MEIENLNLKLSGELPVTKEELEQLRLNGQIPITREELLEFVNSWGRKKSFQTTDGIYINYLPIKECYPLENLDVSQIEDLSDIFCYSFYDGDLAKWNISNAKSIAYMFYESIFNNDSLKDWNTSSVIDMSNTFKNSKFNGNISNWNVSNVINMRHMFYNSSFNKDISKWNVSSCLYLDCMFFQGKFDGDISKWKFNKDVSCHFLINHNHNFEEKYDFGNYIPDNSDLFLKWFEENKDKIANTNITKAEILDINDYLSNFDIDKELNNDK